MDTPGGKISALVWLGGTFCRQFFYFFIMEVFVIVGENIFIIQNFLQVGGWIMCNATFFTAMQFVGTMMSSYGQLQEGRASAAESNYKAQIASNNAIIANQNAEAALDKGRADVRDVKRKTRQIIGLQRAELAAQGFDVGEGSSIDILGDTAALGELDVLRIQADAENRALNFKRQADSFTAQGRLDIFAGRNEETAGRIDAASTLLTGASKVGSDFLKKKPKRKP